jgi:hypothetical protein
VYGEIAANGKKKGKCKNVLPDDDQKGLNMV